MVSDSSHDLTCKVNLTFKSQTEENQAITKENQAISPLLFLLELWNVLQTCRKVWPRNPLVVFNSFPIWPFLQCQHDLQTKWHLKVNYMKKNRENLPSHYINSEVQETTTRTPKYYFEVKHVRPTWLFIMIDINMFLQNSMMFSRHKESLNMQYYFLNMSNMKI